MEIMNLNNYYTDEKLRQQAIDLIANQNPIEKKKDPRELHEEKLGKWRSENGIDP